MKKKAVFILISSMLFGLWACEDDTENNMGPDGQSGQKEFTVENVQSVQINSKVSLIASNDDVDQNTVVVEAPTDLIDMISIESDNDVLIISASDTTGSDIGLDDSIKVYISPENLEEIILEANQEAVFMAPSDVMENISIETKGSSKLQLMDLKVNHLDLDMKGNSEVTLESGGESNKLDSMVITDTLAQVVGMDSLMLSDSSIVSGDSLKVVENNDGDTIEFVVYTMMAMGYIAETAMINTTGDIQLDAGNFPVNELEIYLVGNSEATVNATDMLKGSGMGNSKLWYYGNPTIEFSVQGNAEIIPVQPPGNE